MTAKPKFREKKIKPNILLNVHLIHVESINVNEKKIKLTKTTCAMGLRRAVIAMGAYKILFFYSLFIWSYCCVFSRYCSDFCDVSHCSSLCRLFFSLSLIVLCMYNRFSSHSLLTTYTYKVLFVLKGSKLQPIFGFQPCILLKYRE